MALNFSNVVALSIPSYEQLSYIHFNSTDNRTITGFAWNTANPLHLEFGFSVDTMPGLNQYREILKNSGGHFRLVLNGSGLWVDVNKSNEGYTEGQFMYADEEYRVVLDAADSVFTMEVYDSRNVLVHTYSRDITVTESNTIVFYEGDYNIHYWNWNSDMYVPCKNILTGAACLYKDSNNIVSMSGTVNSSTYGAPVAPTVAFSGSASVLQITDSQSRVLWEAGPRLTSITLSGYNTSLNKDSTFIYGGTVTAHYSDNSTADVTLSTTFTGYDMSTAGSQTVTASYTENGITKTATYTLTVVAASWHTVWSGSRKFGVKWKTSSTGQNTTTGTGSYLNSGLVAGAQTKITFTLQDVNTNSSKITTKGTSTGSFTLSSPVDFTSGALGSDLLAGDVYYTSVTSLKFSFALTTNSSGGSSVSISNISGYNVYGRESYITITKIEQYY